MRMPSATCKWVLSSLCGTRSVLPPACFMWGLQVRCLLCVSMWSVASCVFPCGPLPPVCFHVVQCLLCVSMWSSASCVFPCGAVGSISPHQYCLLCVSMWSSASCVFPCGAMGSISPCQYCLLCVSMWGSGFHQSMSVLPPVCFHVVQWVPSVHVSIASCVFPCGVVGSISPCQYCLLCVSMWSSGFHQSMSVLPPVCFHVRTES